jgi:hypothetical protein
MLVALATCTIHAQLTGTGNIQGTVTDTSGARIADATVTLTSTATGVKQVVRTDSAGDYLFPNINIGTYNIRTAAPNFKAYEQTNIVLEVGSNIAINPILNPGAEGEVVEVHSDSLALQTEDSSFKQTIDQQDVQEMPLNGRQMTALIFLSGGSSPAPTGDFTGSKYSYQTIAVSVAGGMGNTTEWKLDGGDNNDYMGNGNLPFPFPDAVAQFSVESTVLGAQSGSTHSGGLVNVVTRSGTNQYHGSAFEFIRNNYIDASNFFSTSPDSLHQNQFGGTFGGPIKRNKLFAFAGYQRTRETKAASNTEMYIPTAANLAGDWSVTDPPCVPGPTPGSCTSGQQLYDPLTGAAIPGNKYPSPPAYNAQALKLYSYLPAINPAIDTDNQGEVSFAIPSEIFDNQFVTRVDYTINPKHNLYARYLIDGYQHPSFFSDHNILITSQAPGNYQRVQTATVGEAWTIRSNLVNSIHISGTKRVDLRRSTPGINGNSLGINQFDEESTGLQIMVSTNGKNHYWNAYCSTCTPGYFNVDNEGVSDDLTYIKGQHQLVIGGEFIKVHFNEVAAYEANGEYTFNGEFSGSGPLGGPAAGDANLDFLWGAMNSFQQSKEQQNALRAPIPTLYIQDTYHVNKRLTIVGGLRWEPEFMPHDQFNRGSTFSMPAFLADQISTFYPQAPAGSFYYGDPGVPKTFTTNEVWNFNPNFGATWDPVGNGKTVIRGGLQLTYDEANFYTANRNHQNPPFATISSPNITGPICFSEPWLVGGTGFGCDQVGGTDSSPYPQPAVPTPAQAIFPAQSGYDEIVSPFKVADTLQWTLSVQHEFADGWQAEIDYIGNKTTNMPVSTPMDQAIYTPGVWGPAGTGCGSVVTLGPAAVAALTLGGGPVGTPCSTTGNQQARFLLTEANPSQGNQYAGGSTYVNDIAYANYNGMVATLQHRMSSTFSLLTNFTWSRCNDVADAAGDQTYTAFEDPYDLHKDYARCGSDYGRIFNATLVYRTAFPLHGFVKALVNDWEVAPLISILSGSAIDIYSGEDISLTDIGNDRPNKVPGVNPKTGYKIGGGASAATTANRAWLNLNAFCADTTADNLCTNPVATGTFGNLGYNSVNGPMTFQNDAQVSRIFPIHESWNIDARLEAFNFLNHPSFSNPSAYSPQYAGFGEIYGTSINARVFQGSLKVIF